MSCSSCEYFEMKCFTMSSTCAYSPQRVITTGKKDDKRQTRPVRTDHHAPRSERVEDDGQIGGEVLLLPVLPIGFRHHSRNLDIHVGEGGQRLCVRSETDSHAYSLLPLTNDMVLDKGLCDVVDHEGLVGELLHELLRHLEMLGVDEDVVREVVLLKQLDSPQERGTQEEFVVGLVLNLVIRDESRAYNVTKTDQLLVLRVESQLHFREESADTFSSTSSARKSSQPTTPITTSGFCSARFRRNTVSSSHCRAWTAIVPSTP